MGAQKDMHDLIKTAQKAGWVISLTKKSHHKWTAPTGQFMYTSGSPSDTRALMRIKSDLKRLGLVIDKRNERK